MMRLAFTKMHGLGNDFIVFDAERPEEVPSPDALRRLADRRTGIGFDQALVMAPARRSGTDVYYRIFNADGLKALDFEVPRGSVVALLGPNGSGKTTSIKAAAGLIRPTSGEVLLGAEGLNALDARARRLVSFLPQRVSFPDTLTGREVVEFYRRLRQAPADSADRVLKFASLNGAGSRAVGTYSGGMRQRLGLAVASLASTEVLLLDEPTAALDPDGLCAFYGLVDARRKAGHSVFFSSHQLGDVERLADLVAVIVSGSLVALFTERELAARLADRGPT